MPRKRRTGQQAERLLQALQATDDLTSAHVRDLLPAFVAAEQAGEDVDRDPAYAALLRHLDRCEDCMALYTDLAEDLEALADEEQQLGQAPLTPPSFFTPARQANNAVVRVIKGLKRRFALDLAIPALAPARPTLGDRQRATLFADNLAELPGAPLVSVSISANEGLAELLVAIREASAETRWRVRLVLGDTVRAATTDERGIARFDRLPVEGLEGLTLICSEITA